MKIWKYIKFALWGYWRIPKGDYCYSLPKGSENATGCFTPRKIYCPYWDQIEDRHHQENGYCHWLGYGDYEINHDDSREFLNVKTGEVDTASSMPFGVGLLWDQCKECGLKNYSEKEIEKMYAECMKVRQK